MPPARRTARATSWGETSGRARGSPELTSLIGLAERYGAEQPLELIDPDTLGRPAAARRTLLLRLRNDATLRPPPLGAAERLQPPAQPGARHHPLAELDAEERLLLAGALLDGLDANALAHATQSNAKAVKAAVRRLLTKLDPSIGQESEGLDAAAKLMAGEYALGLLQPGAQSLFERALAHDAELQRCVEEWDARLNRLVATTAARPTPAAAAPPEPAVAHAATPSRWNRQMLMLGALALLALPVAWALIDRPEVAWQPPAALPEAQPAAAAPPSFGELQTVPAPETTALPPATPPPAGRATEAVPPVLASTEVEATGDLPPVDARLIVNYSNGNGAAARASRIADGLAGAGVEVALMGATDADVLRDRVRYFFAEDAAAADDLQQVLARIGTEVDVQDFTHYRPLPTPGTLEIWLAADGP